MVSDEDRRAGAFRPAKRRRENVRALLVAAGLACLGAPTAGGPPPPQDALVPRRPDPGLAVRCTDESETGAYLEFADAAPGIVSIRLRGEPGADYPGFAIEPAAYRPQGIRFVVSGDGAKHQVAPEILRSSGGVPRWERLPVEFQDHEARFTVTASAARQVVRLWDAEDAEPLLERRSPAGDGEGGVVRRGLAASCAGACYSPGAFCYDYERLKCYLDSLAGEPHVQVSVLGRTKPCPGEANHQPREVFKVRITDDRVPLAAKARIVLTPRVHGGERLTSFVAEGVMDYAIGRSVEPEGAGFLPDLPPRPRDLLERLDLIVYPMLNPDGSADLDGDGGDDFSRYKCGIDLNRRWGDRGGESEAHEVHLVHQDLHRRGGLEALRVPPRLPRLEPGLPGRLSPRPRHLRGQARGARVLTVTEEYVAREARYFAVEQDLIPYRAGQYTINSPGNGPVPGMARFALYREFAPLGLLTNTSETSLVLSGGKAVSDPPFAGGGDLRHEGAWFLLALYQALAAPAGSAGLMRGDVNGNGAIDLSECLETPLLSLRRGRHRVRGSRRRGRQLPPQRRGRDLPPRLPVLGRAAAAAPGGGGPHERRAALRGVSRGRRAVTASRRAPEAVRSRVDSCTRVGRRR